jgi:ribonuclease P protein subunit RPR2
MNTKEIALERMEILLNLAEKYLQSDEARSRRYVELAWRIATHCRVRFPPHLKRKFCRKCKTFWKPGVTCRVRLKRGVRVITCLKCGRVYRVPYK